MFNNTGIVGVGLIGSSLALEIKENSLSRLVTGFDADQKSLDTAVQKGIIDSYATLDKIDMCDFVIVATPAGSIPDVLKSVFGKLKKNSIVIDVGSVKSAVIDRVKNSLVEGVHYIPLHPIAGIEKFGVKAAQKGLFRDAYCIITPFDGINQSALESVEKFMQNLGMKIEFMKPDEHDEVFSYISHLPHLIAYALVNLAKEKNNEKFKFIGGGFRDFTRIASSSEKMWGDIFLMNKNKLLKAVSDFEGSINKIKQFIETENMDELVEYLRQARLFKRFLNER